MFQDLSNHNYEFVAIGYNVMLYNINMIGIGTITTTVIDNNSDYEKCVLSGAW